MKNYRSQKIQSWFESAVHLHFVRQDEVCQKTGKASLLS